MGHLCHKTSIIYELRVVGEQLMKFQCCWWVLLVVAVEIMEVP
jgi:hypothetical protein